MKRDAASVANLVPARGKAAAAPAMRPSSLQTRETILAAATREFADKGYDGGRVDEIALRAGIQKNVMYYYFGNKDRLFSAVLERAYETIRARQRDLQLRHLSPVEGMRKLVIFTGWVWVQFPEFLRLLTSENIHEGRHVRASGAIPQLYDPLLETIDDLLARGAKAGVFRRGIDPIDLYISIWALSAHYISNHHTFEAIFRKRLMTHQRVRQRLDHAADMVLRYVLASVTPSVKRTPQRRLTA